MNRARDEMLLMSVCERVSTHLYTHAYVSQDFVLDAQHKLEDANKALLRKQARLAHEQGVQNGTKGASGAVQAANCHVPQCICCWQPRTRWAR